MDFDNVITSVDELAGLYRAPSQLVQDKTVDHVDDTSAAFIANSTFVLIGTTNAAGRGDVSPKGGPAGFVKVVDESTIVIPDLNGNNRIDTIRNLIECPGVGLLFLVPATGEMLRVTGRGVVTTDPAALDLFSAEVRRPTTAIAVHVDEAMLHCAKAIRRAGLWEPDTWTGSPPTAGEMLVAHLGTSEISAADIDSGLDAGYARDLAADAPETV